MNSSVVEAPHTAVPDLAGLEPVEKIKRRWPMILGGGLTLLMILSLGRELFGSGLSGLARALPTNPLFYMAFLVYYLGPPTFDYLIFRRLWKIPLDGMAALHKKRIANEVLLGYSGEAYFYAWARQRTQMVAAPFGAVKDVMILSAIAGNAVTLAVMAVALPLCIELLTPTYQTYAYGSVAVIILMSLPFLIFSKRVFSLPAGDLAWVFGIHCLRIVLGSVVIALAWHFAMPSVPVGFWLLMSAGRLLVWRLPLIPSKELAFSAIAGVLIGQGHALSELMALVAGMVLFCHVALMGGFSIQSLVAKLKA
ncbi:hypothetical protein [Sphingomonas soli]|uniref:hypothetical protein n=1 Tax=Sphingomonas soli TaxID=266127 RepID=UPI000A021EB9|nr:hypothetical protein [Sphingomonas soli]